MAVDFVTAARAILAQGYSDAYQQGYDDAITSAEDQDILDTVDEPVPEDVTDPEQYLQGAEATEAEEDAEDAVAVPLSTDSPDFMDASGGGDVVDAAASDQTDYLGALAVALAAGLSLAALDNRLGLYAASTNSLYEQGFGTGVGQLGGGWTVTWHTAGDAGVCDLCDERDGESWAIDDDYPYPGEGIFGDQCEGGPLCRCELVYTYDPGADTTTAAAVADLTKESTADLLVIRSLLAGADSFGGWTVLELSRLSSFLAKYAAKRDVTDEPRDEAGKWTAGGGDSLGGLQPHDFPSGHEPGRLRDLRQLAASGIPPDIIAFRPGADRAWAAQARDSLAQAIRTGTPAARMPMAAFRQLVSDGEMQNVYQTGSTRAASGTPSKLDSYTRGRMYGEQQSFGIPIEASGDARPVYGYIAPNEQDTLHADNPDQVRAAVGLLPVPTSGDPGTPLDQARYNVLAANPDNYILSYQGGAHPYADVMTRDEYRALNDRLGGKADWQAYMGDKRNTYVPLGDGHGNINAPAVVAWSNREYGAAQYGDVQVNFDRSVLDNATVTGGDSLDLGLVGAPARLAEAGDPRVPIGLSSAQKTWGTGGSAYIEAQFYDHPTVDQVASVTFAGSKPPRDITSVLDSRGIKWSFDPTPKLSATDKIPFSQVIGGA